MQADSIELRWMRARRGVGLVLACLAAAACTSKLGENTLKQTAQQADNSATANGDPCSLLDTTEVIAAIGPLAGPPYNSSQGDPNCEYDTKDYRRIQVSVDWSGGKMAMKMMNFGRALTDKALRAETQTGVVLKTGDTLHGNWDQIAMTPAQCCSLDALLGDRHVQLDWAGTKLTLAQAAALLNTAIKRLDHPLAITGAAGAAAAKARLAAMAQDSALDVCTLVSASEAAAILGPLSGPPDHGSPQTGQRKTSCYYHTPIPNMPNGQYTYEIDLKEWHDAHAQFAEDQYIINGAVNGMRRQLMGADSITPPAEPPGPWDDLGSSVSGGYEAVKGPVMLIGSAMGDHDKLRALLAKAVSALK